MNEKNEEGLPLEDDAQELRALLGCWKAPAPSRSLDGRVMKLFRHEMAAAETGATPRVMAASLQDKSEVVKMKECPTCHETFADRFAFCPTDGTPLPTNGFHPATAAAFETDETVEHAAMPAGAASAATVAAGAAAAGFGAMPRDEFHLTMIRDENVVSRLAAEMRNVAHESQLTYPEFKRDPAGYSKRFVAGYGTLAWRSMSRPNVALSAMAAILFMSLMIAAIIILDGRGGLQASTNPNANLEYIGDFPITEIPEEQPTPEPDTAGDAKGKGGGSKPKQEKPGGGGGGGRQDAPQEVSFGKRPLATLQQPQVLAPRPEPPTIRNPSLPTIATVRADDMLFPPDRRPLPYGDERSRLMTPSAGRGEGDGMGGGAGSGFGRGDGRGVGAGEGENTGGGRTNLGGGGPGGGGGVDYSRPFAAREVTRKAVVTFRPEPGYTEDARKNNIQGVVTLRLLLASSGQVSNISPVKRLPDGLVEKAITAAKQIKFTPAQKDGRNVSQWVTINYTFAIY